VAFTAERFNFEKYKWGRLQEKHASATWNLGIIPPFEPYLLPYSYALRGRKTKKLCVKTAGHRTVKTEIHLKIQYLPHGSRDGTVGILTG
jgi:hypothetical protein